MQIGILRVLNVLPSKMNIKIEIFKGICVAGAFRGVKVSVQDESRIYVLRKSGMRVILIEAIHNHVSNSGRSVTFGALPLTGPMS